MSGAYYCENDAYAAQWLRNLAEAGHILSGYVDDRSIAAVSIEDITSRTQFHAFAGIGVWQAALRDAGWPDDCEVFTGSPPCQPFSAAGRKRGTSDERHLWPEYWRLIREYAPPVVFIEQVASPDGRKWLDAVCTDLEGAGYSVGKTNLCAGGVGAPHIRQRLYIVAIADGERLERVRVQLRERRSQQAVLQARGSSEIIGMADTERVASARRDSGGGSSELDPHLSDGGVANAQRDRRGSRRVDATHGWTSIESDRHSDPLLVGDASEPRGWWDARTVPGTEGKGEGQRFEYRCVSEEFVAASSDFSTAVRGFWSDADWLICQDGKARPTQPFAQSLADGSAFGMGPLCSGVPQRGKRLKGYGNAIVRQVAATFIASVIDVLVER